MKLRIDNSYSDGHRSTQVHDVSPEPAPADLERYDGDGWPLDDNWWHVAYAHTGDGHGIAVPGLGSCYTATIIEADNPALVGQTHEWLD